MSSFEWVWSSGSTGFGNRAPTHIPGLSLEPGTLVGGAYELEGEIARGGMGLVLRARDVRAQRPVAIKLVLQRPSPQQRTRFLREGQVTASLDHPGVVRIHACGEHEGFPFLVYELVERCRTLDEVFQTASREQRLQLLVDAADALGYAHQHGVLHRDVKPGNVLVDEEGRVRVTDFGLAKPTDTEERLTQTGAFVGTPPYMAPEQLSGAGRETPASDVWALGVMLYEALTDRHPFASESLQELAARINKGSYPRPTAIDRTISPALERVCRRALQIDPGQRYPDAGALAADLRDALVHPGSRRLGRLLGGLAALAALAALGFAATTTAPRPEVISVPSAPPPTEPAPTLGLPSSKPPPPFGEPLCLLTPKTGLHARASISAAHFVDPLLLLELRQGGGTWWQAWTPRGDGQRLERAWELKNVQILRVARGPEPASLCLITRTRSQSWLLRRRPDELAAPEGLQARPTDVPLRRGLPCPFRLKIFGASALVVHLRQRVVVERVGHQRSTKRCTIELERAPKDGLLSPSGKLLALVTKRSAESWVSLHTVSTGARRWTVRFSDYNGGLVFSADEQRLAVSSSAHVLVLDVARGSRQVLQGRYEGPTEHAAETLGKTSHPGSSVRRIARLGEHHLLSVSSQLDRQGQNELRCWDLRTLQELTAPRLLDQPRPYTWVAVDPRRRWIASGGKRFLELRPYRAPSTTVVPPRGG